MSADKDHPMVSNVFYLYLVFFYCYEFNSFVYVCKLVVCLYFELNKGKNNIIIYKFHYIPKHGENHL